MYQKEVWTCRGLTTAYVFFVIHLQTRKVLLARATFSPTNQWLKQQIRHVLWICEDQGIKPRFFLCDNDMLYPRDMKSFYDPVRRSYARKVAVTGILRKILVRLDADMALDGMSTATRENLPVECKMHTIRTWRKLKSRKAAVVGIGGTDQRSSTGATHEEDIFLYADDDLEHSCFCTD